MCKLTADITQLYMRCGHRIVSLCCDANGCSASSVAAESSTCRLLKCRTCLRKAYCCKACQTRDWTEGGHKATCRPPKDFRPNDVIRAQVTRSLDEHGRDLSGQILVVVGPEEEPEASSPSAVKAGGPSTSGTAEKRRWRVAQFGAYTGGSYIHFEADGSDPQMVVPVHYTLHEDEMHLAVPFEERVDDLAWLCADPAKVTSGESMARKAAVPFSMAGVLEALPEGCVTQLPC